MCQIWVRYLWLDTGGRGLLVHLPGRTLHDEHPLVHAALDELAAVGRVGEVELLELVVHARVVVYLPLTWGYRYFLTDFFC